MRLTSRFQGFSGPVGSGKSMAMCDKAIHLANANPGRVGLLGAPTYPMLRDATLKTLMWRLETHQIAYRRYISEERIVLLKTGSEILCRAVEAFDRLRGTNLAWFAVDELSYCPEHAWLQLVARLRDPYAVHRVGCACWTPNGFDWVYRRFISEATKIDGYECILAQPFENTFLPQDYYENMIRSYAPAFARQEVLGKYENIYSGRAYPEFGPANIWRRDAGAPKWQGRECKYNPARPLLWSLDFNINPASSVIAQSMPKFLDVHQRQESKVGGLGMQLNILDELFLADRNTYQVCEEFHRRVLEIKKPGMPVLLYVYGDPAGTQRKSSATKTDWQIVRDFLNSHPEVYKHSFRVRAAHPHVKDRVNAVNNLCTTMKGDHWLMVHERCRELIIDLETNSWEQDSHKLLLPQIDETDKMRGHLTAALGYLIEREFPLMAKSGLRKGYLGTT